MKSTIEALRARAITHSLFGPAGLQAAIDRLGFVQADPIRAPARAQDLILRHRVRSYRAGSLERRYPTLQVEEDLLHAYGFLPRSVGQWLHPRPAIRLPSFELEVLATVRAAGSIHPSELTAHHGPARVPNAWGGWSKATKQALERLHYRGYLRVARRDQGVRVYQVAPGRGAPVAPGRRLRMLVQLVANLLAPVPVATLRGIAARLRKKIPGAPEHQTVIRGLCAAGALERQTVDGVVYLWPAESQPPAEPVRRVRFLAPFDPLVWDRRRFEHLWQWAYRFEAYTPPARRQRGYYAMPLLWGDRVIGWANADTTGGVLRVDLGFIDRRPRDRTFRREVDAEIERLAQFLAPILTGMGGRDSNPSAL